MNAMTAKSCCLLLLTLAGCAFAPRAFATECSVGASAVDFGIYDPTSTTALDGQGSVTINCTNGPNTMVTISLDTGGSGTYTPRRMVSGAEILNYNLYTNVGRTIIFGNGTGTSTATCMTGTGLNQPDCTGNNPVGTNRNTVRTVYGRIPALQNVTGAAGDFTDTIPVTVTF